MAWLYDKNNLLRLTGIMAICGMALIMFVDIKLLYMPLPLKEYSTFRAAMARPREEILLYSKLAIFAVPLILIGLFHIYLTVMKSNKILAWVTTFVFCFGYINAAFYYAYLGYVMSTAHLLVPLHLKIPFFTEHMYFLFQMQYFGSIIAGSIFFFLGLSFFKNNYPKKFIWINPLYLIGVFRFILPIAVPPAISGLLLTATFNGVMLITMTLSTFLLWQKPLNELLPASSKTGIEAA